MWSTCNTTSGGRRWQRTHSNGTCHKSFKYSSYGTGRPTWLDLSILTRSNIASRSWGLQVRPVRSCRSARKAFIASGRSKNFESMPGKERRAATICSQSAHSTTRRKDGGSIPTARKRSRIFSTSRSRPATAESPNADHLSIVPATHFQVELGSLSRLRDRGRGLAHGGNQ